MAIFVILDSALWW